jgi:hypothetical protein
MLVIPTSLLTDLSGVGVAGHIGTGGCLPVPSVRQRSCKPECRPSGWARQWSSTASSTIQKLQRAIRSNRESVPVPLANVLREPSIHSFLHRRIDQLEEGFLERAVVHGLCSLSAVEAGRDVAAQLVAEDVRVADRSSSTCTSPHTEVRWFRSDPFSNF